MKTPELTRAAVMAMEGSVLDEAVAVHVMRAELISRWGPGTYARNGQRRYRIDESGNITLYIGRTQYLWQPHENLNQVAKAEAMLDPEQLGRYAVELLNATGEVDDPWEFAVAVRKLDATTLCRALLLATLEAAPQLGE